MKNPFEMTPEQIAKDEAQIAEIRARNIARNELEQISSTEAANDDSGFAFMDGDRDARIAHKEDSGFKKAA